MGCWFPQYHEALLIVKGCSVEVRVDFSWLFDTLINYFTAKLLYIKNPREYFEDFCKASTRLLDECILIIDTAPDYRELYALPKEFVVEYALHNPLTISYIYIMFRGVDLCNVNNVEVDFVERYMKISSEHRNVVSIRIDLSDEDIAKIQNMFRRLIMLAIKQAHENVKLLELEKQ